MKYKTKLFAASAVLIGSLSFGKVLNSKLSSKVDNILEEISTPIEHITSSLQHKEPGKALAETLMEESQAGNYVAITSSFIMNPLKRDSSYKISAYAKILENGIPTDIGDITIGGHTMSADSLNEYQFQFPLAEGKALHGDSISVSLSEPNARTARTLGTKKIVVPKEFYPASMSLPSLSIDRANSYTLNWQPDPNNQYGLVQIQLSYNPGLSQYYNSSQPSSIDDLVYRVADNGSYSIPSSDLSRFPKDGYVSISITRAWKLSSSGNIVYVAIVEAKTPPLLVVDCPDILSISGDNNFCATSNNYTITNFLPGSTVQWQATPAGIVTINSPYSQQTTLSKNSGGIITLTAAVNSTCGGAKTISKTVTVGVPDRPKVFNENGQQITSVSTCTDVYKSLCPTIDPKWGILEWQWEKVTGNFDLLDFESCADILGFQPGSGFISVRVRNACGWSNPTLIVVNVKDCSSMTMQQTSIKLFPNPATSSVTLSVDNQKDVQSKAKEKENLLVASINEVKIYDNFGSMKLYRKFAKQQTAALDISSLPNGVYVVEVATGSGLEYQQLMIQK